jgi:hypothetical protein
MIESDVQHARNRLNFSRWGEYSREERLELLEQIPNMIQGREMPLPRYLRLHPEAKPSDGDIARVSAWARIEHNRLRSAPRPKVGTLHKKWQVEAASTARRETEFIFDRAD